MKLSCFLAFAVWLNACASIITTIGVHPLLFSLGFALEDKNYTVMHDLGHLACDITFTPNTFDPNIMVEYTLLLFVLFFIYVCYNDSSFPYALTRHIMRKMAVFYIVRAVCICITFIPDSRLSCSRSPNGFLRYLNESFCVPKDVYVQLNPYNTMGVNSYELFRHIHMKASQLIQNPHHCITCNDMILSGHSMIVILLFYVVSSYSRSLVLAVLSFLWMIIGLTSIVCSRLHYSIDVVLVFVFLLCA
jgi:hypothetical protein